MRCEYSTTSLYLKVNTFHLRKTYSMRSTTLQNEKQLKNENHEKYFVFLEIRNTEIYTSMTSIDDQVCNIHHSTSTNEQEEKLGIQSQKFFYLTCDNTQLDGRSSHARQNFDTEFLRRYKKKNMRSDNQPIFNNSSVDTYTWISASLIQYPQME